MHDIGLTIDRETHHIESGKFVDNSNFLNLLFNYDDIEIIRHAVEDHRASNDNVPRNIYGKIIADADRSDIINFENFLSRCWNYRRAKFDKMSDKELFEEIYEHMFHKLSESGNFKFILPETMKLLKDDLARSRLIIKDKKKAYDIFLKLRKTNILKR